MDSGGGIKMLFHTFVSQEERKAFGGSDFLELQKCRLPQETLWKKILSVETVEHWRLDSLYIFGEDFAAFYALYGEIFGKGFYIGGESGKMDICGMQYYTAEQTAQIIEGVKQKRPKEFQVLLDWLAEEKAYNGIYLLGI